MPTSTHSSDAIVRRSSAADGYVFDDFTVDLTSRRLLRHDEVVVLPSRVFDVLVHLIEHQGRPVQKDEIIGTIWDNVVVTDDSLIHAISVLRRALADDPQKPRYIETIPRRGYRFMAVAQAIQHNAAADPAAAVQVSIAPDVERTAELEQTAGALHASALPSTPPAVTVAAVTAAVADEVPAGSPAQSGVREGAGMSKGMKAGMLAAGFMLAASILAVVAVVLLRAPDAIETEAAAELAQSRTVRMFQTAPSGHSIVSGGVLSPDSRYLAFIAQDSTTGKTGLWLRSLQTGEARLVHGTQDATMPFWSPDATRLGYIANSRLVLSDLHGEDARTIASVSAAAGATWSSDDTIVFAEWNTGLFTVPASGDGSVQTLMSLQRSARDIAFAWPQFLPDGRHFLYQIASLDSARSGAYIGSLDTLQSVKLLDTASAATFVEPNHILHLQQDMLVAEEIDLQRLELTVQAVVLARGLSEPRVATDKFVFASRDLLAFRNDAISQNLTWFNRAGEVVYALTLPTVQFNPRLSPDGTQLLASASVTADPGLWLARLDNGQVTRIEVDAIAPLWSRDGQRIAFTSRDGAEMHVRALDEREPARRLLNDESLKVLADWTPDGKQLLFTRRSADTGLDLWLTDIASGAVTPLLASIHDETQARLSPDGQWIAFASDESGTMETWVARFPTMEDRQQVSVAGGGQPQWRADQRELFFLAADKTLMAVEIAPGDSPVLSTPYPLFRTAIGGALGDAREYYAVDPTGTLFLVDTVVSREDEQHLTILVNWNSASGSSAAAMAQAGN